MTHVGTAVVVAVLLANLNGTAAFSQTPSSAPQQNIPIVQPPANHSETTGAGTPSQRELGPANVVPPDGATDRAPPSKLQPGELTSPQNPKAK
jgi:hypothetical protein